MDDSKHPSNALSDQASSQLLVRSPSRSNEVANFEAHENVEEIDYKDAGRFWYKEAVFYEVYVRAYCDSNDDGYGDLQGTFIAKNLFHFAR